MSNKQFVTSHYSVVNNSVFNYSNSQGFGNFNNIKLPFNESGTIDPRNNKSKTLAHRSYIDNNFFPNNDKIFPYKCEPVIVKENEIQEMSAWDLAEIHSRKANKREILKRNIFEQKAEVIKEVISERKTKTIIMEEKEKLQLEKDIVTIISHALKFSKQNTPLTAMMSNEMNEELIKLNKQRKQQSSGSLNKSIGSLINISNISGVSGNNRYDSNRFLKALGLDVTNLNSDNININIDCALDQIAKWRLVDKTKIRNLIRMRVINEISSIEERRTVQKLKNINAKFKKLKKNSSMNMIKPQYQHVVTDSKEKNSKEKSPRNIINNKSFDRYLPNNISTYDNKDYSKIADQHLSMQENYNKDKSAINNTNNTNETTNMMKSTMLKTNFDDFSGITKSNNVSIFKSKSKKKGKKYNIEIQAKKKEVSKKKKKIIMNSYSQAEKLLKIVYTNSQTRGNKNLVSHFENVLDYKNADTMMNNVIYRNKIVSSIGQEVDELVQKVPVARVVKSRIYG